MKIFANMNIWKKLLMVLILLVLVAFVVPKPVQAEGGLGGALMTAVTDLFIGLADGINTLVQKFFIQQDPTILVVADHIDVLKVVIGVVIGIGIMIAAIVTSLPTITFLVIGGAITLTVGFTYFNDGQVIKTNQIFQTISGISAHMLSGDEIALPLIQLTPYEIFSNKGDIFSVNIFKKYDKEAKNKPIITELREVIANWYSKLRMIAIVGMMSVLVYIGIRMVISSSSDSKAKYKQMLWDWLVAMCLLFIMHYLMSFSNLIVDEVTNVINTIETSKSVNGEITYEYNGIEGFLIGAESGDNGMPVKIKDANDKMKRLVKKAYTLMIGDKGNEITNQYKPYFWKDVGGPQAENEKDAEILFWPANNFTTQARLRVQLIKDNQGVLKYDYIGYVFIYVFLTLFTCVFIAVYLKRLIYMVFLTLISPLVALTYPIDKVKDGQAQAFNFWFREYMYNLLLQPLHLLLYTILVGMAMGFASKNPVYVFIVLMFMVPMEKLLKEMFGFKGTTPGSMPGLAAGALMMNATRNLFGGGSKTASANSKKSSGGNDDEDVVLPPKVSTSSIFDNFKQGSNGDNSNDGGTPRLDDNNNPNVDNQDDNNDELDDSAIPWLDYAENPDNFMDSPQKRNLDNHLLNNPQSDEDSTEEQIQPNNNKPSLPSSDNSQLDSSLINNDNKNKSKNYLDAISSVVGRRRRRLWGRNRAVREWKRGNKKGAVGIAASGLGKGVIKGVAKGASLGLKVAGTTAGAGIGLFAAGVSGDPSKIAENVVAGGLIGKNIATNGVNAISGATLNDSARGFANEVRDEYISSDSERQAKYEQKLRSQYADSILKDNSKMDLLRRNKVSNEQMSELEEIGIDDYVTKYGLYDEKDIARAEQYRYSEKGKVKSREEAVQAVKLQKQIAGGNYKGLAGKDKQKYKDDFIKEFISRGNDEATARINADKVEKELLAISDINIT